MVLAHPQLSQEELEEEKQEEESAFAAGSLGVVSLNLQARTLEPVLSIDKRMRIEGEYFIHVQAWSTGEEGAPQPLRTFTLTNDTMADLIMNLSVEGPFEIVKTKSNTGAVHPLATSTPSKSIVAKKVESMFCVQPSKLVEITLRFLHPNPRDIENWPNIMRAGKDGLLNISYANGANQIFKLRGVLLRPKLFIQTQKPSKNDKAQDELDLG